MAADEHNPAREILLLGPYGVLGTGVVDAVAANPAWRVVTAARRPAPAYRERDGVRHINVDLLDREGTREILTKLDTVTDLVFAAYVEKPTMAETVEPNARMFRNALDAFSACFPAGTLSGAPKVRAMQIIEELEPTRRGIYGGSVLYADFAGNLDSCIGIRTLLMQGKKAYLQAGAGIVADSDPASEFQESMNKAQAVLRAVEKARATQ